MKDEIKEILCTSNKNYISSLERDYIFNYITNLQEKYERMKENAEILSNGYNELEKRNEKAISMLKKLNIKLKDILKIGIDIKEISDIENILQGEDKDE